MKHINVENVKSFYQWLNHKGYSTELNIFPEGKHPVIRFVDSEEAFVDFCTEHVGEGNNYAGINPRPIGITKRSAKNVDIPVYMNGYIDCDPIRDKDTAATDDELERSEKLADKVIEWFVAKGFSKPIKCMSGNGFHLLFAIPPIELCSQNLHIVKMKFKLFQEQIRRECSLDGIRIDSTFEPRRIVKVYGTLSVKGNPSLHRLSTWGGDERQEDGKLRRYILDIDVESKHCGAAHSEASTDAEKIRKCHNRAKKLIEKTSSMKKLYEDGLVDRSKADFRIVSFLIKRDIPKDVIYGILCDTSWSKVLERGTEYFDNTFDNAVAKSKHPESPKSLARTKPGFNPRPYSEAILESHRLVYDKYKRLWIYNSDAGIWKVEGELIVDSILRKDILGEKDYKRYCVQEILADLKGLTFTDIELKEPPPYLIPFRNCIYNLKTDERLEFDQEHFFINKLPVNLHDSKTECPTIDRIFRELVKPEDVITLYEIPTYCFYRAYPYPKIFILYGSGANGKTVYTKILTRLLGRDNVSLVSSDDLQFNRFASSSLFGKLLNISGEMDYAILKNTSKLKMCCGEDLIYCERKFREAFPFTNYAKMIFLTNQVPVTRDKTLAFYRRVFLLEFPNKFILNENADPMLIDKIPQDEFEGLAWRCVKK